MSRVVVAASEDLAAIAVAAGGSPKEMIYHEDTGELECPDVAQQSNLDTALTSVTTGTALVTAGSVKVKVEALSAAAEALIVSGFKSKAGALHPAKKWYDSTLEDQLNLVGNVSSMNAGETALHPYRDTQKGDKIYLLHSKAQLRKVLGSGRDRKLAILIEYATLKAQCLAATTLGELGAITWTMT